MRCPDYQYYFDHSETPTHFRSRKDLLREASYRKNESDLWWCNLNKGQAEIHMMALAESIYDAVNESTPKQLEEGEWHIPFEDRIKEITRLRNYVNLVKISTAMAAHTSYTIVGGEVVKSYEKWIELHDKLISQDPPHSSPLEHCARAMSDEEYQSFYKGKCYAEITMEEEIFNQGWCNNLKGFIPYRYMIDNKIS